MLVSASDGTLSMMLDDVLMLDSNAIDLFETTAAFGYLRSRGGLQIVPVRRAREESELAPLVPKTPLGPERDAPVPLLLNCPNRTLNDQGVVLLSPRMAELERAMALLYGNPSNHAADITNVAAAFVHGEELLRQGRAARAFFVSADRICCSRAQQLAVAHHCAVGVLHARVAPSRPAQGVQELGREFPR